MAVSDFSDQSILYTSPDEVKSGIRSYFANLVKKPAIPPQVPKPWMMTPSILKLKEKVSTCPFVWRQLLTLDSQRMLLRKGNRKPSPGPDGWEKWLLALLPDKPLLVIIQSVQFLSGT